MRKILTILMLLALTVPAWAGEQTITISRKDGQFNSAEGVYYASKGGVTMTMSGGMNNSNFLVLRHMNTVTFKSANFAIKKIIFHCLDDFTSSNLDVFYWGPTTMNVMTVNYKPAGSNTTTAVTPGKFTASGYDGTWTSDFTGTWTSVFRTTDGSTDETRTHTKFPNGWPAGNSLIFGSRGKPVRFSSIDIVIEKEDGDIYDLVTSIDQVQNNHNYLIVNWPNAKALSVNKTEGKVNEQVHTGSPVTFISGHVDDTGQYDQYAKVKTDGEAQIIKFEKRTSDLINEDRPWLLNAGGNYLRITSSANSSPSNNVGRDLYGISSVNNNYSFAKIELGSQSFGYNARIRYIGSTVFPYSTTSAYRIAYNQSNNYFRDLEYSSTNTNTDQNIRLYTPAQNYNVTTEVRPDASKGSISLRDGVIVSDESATSGTSQQYETVSFLVNPANGYKISNVTIQAGTSTIDPESVTITTNGTLYTFVMPASDVNIVAEFEEVQYHNIFTEVKPNVNYGNIFLTEGYVVQQNQVKSVDGEHIVFNIVANPKDPNNVNSPLYELYSVVIKNNTTNEEISYTYADGNYSFTMPDDDVTITATFIYEADGVGPLYLLGTANGNEIWLPYGPRFNYDPNTNNGQYYLDVYFKGTGNYGDQTGNSNGEFSFVWKYGESWEAINNQGVRGVPWSNDELAGPGHDQQLHYSDEGASENNHYSIPAGLYTFYVKSYGYHNDWLYVAKHEPTLTFDPVGGVDAASAVEVPQNQLVALQGDLYNKIKAINPNEADANFMYKATKTVAGNATTETENATTVTSNISVLDVVNEGETVTELKGWNYLGWIVASNTGYYKVISTPLHWIEENGEKDKTYTVSDRLQGVYAQGGHLWCKDLGDISIVKTEPNTDQVDYLAKTLKTTGHIFANNMRIGNWDQSNWVELDFSGFGPESIDMASALVNKCIKAGTVTGVYSDDVNYTITLTAEPEADGDATYVPNTYCTSNFIEENLKIGNNVGPTANGTTYYFLNPKIQEYAIITFAMWDVDKQIMVVPGTEPFNGAACIGRWDLNNFGDQLSALDAASEASETCYNQYEFHIIVQRTNKSYGSPINASKAATPLKPNQTASDVIRTQPLDLQASSQLPTAITTVGTEAQVVGVEYVNIAGMRSSKPWQGVNIIVTRYSDGTTTTTKVVMK